MADSMIYALIVIYNKRCIETVACKCLRDIEGIRVILADNSTEPNDNMEFAKKVGWEYVGMGGNAGLSRAYNRAIDRITDPNGIVCLFDDDTKVGAEYFDILAKKARLEPKTKVFLPLVFDEIGLLSPSVIQGFAVKRVTDTTEITPETINGINSGMAIRREVFSDYHYDENYFLDCIDHAFLRDMKRRGYPISVFDARLSQAFFANSDPDVSTLIRRFRIYKKDFNLFCGNSAEGRRFFRKEVSEQKKALVLKYKDARLLLM